MEVHAEDGRVIWLRLPFMTRLQIDTKSRVDKFPQLVARWQRSDLDGFLQPIRLVMVLLLVSSFL